MTHASLFSGIGGFDLAAQWAGWTNLFNCEIDTFCQTVLKHHFPNATQYSDIKTTDFTPWRGRVDVLTGGFPCQPFSVAGKRKGMEDDRYLWPEMLRAIREISPNWIVGENVRGIVNWSKGLVFEQVCADLEALGYEVQPFVIPACGVDVPHRRDRVWFIAHANNDRQWKRSDKQEPISRSVRTSDNCPTRDERATSDTKSPRQSPRTSGSRQEQFGRRNERMGVSTDWRYFPTQSPVCGRNDGLSARLDGITFPKWRAESIKGFGNAIVPHVALQIFNAINDYHNL